MQFMWWKLKGIKMNQESRSDSNIKDKVSKSALILGVILGGLVSIFYFMENLEMSQMLLYPLGLLFLIWFATRRNGCGSCNQVSNS